jgi:hypothetical protein
MRRTLIAIVLFALLGGVAIQAEESPFYPVTVSVVKIFAHADGYEIVYRKGTVDTAIAYIPVRWFVPGGKAELVKGFGPAYPYLVVFYKDGKFDHLRLYVQRNVNDPSWGVLAPDAGKGKFDAEDLKLEF